MTRTNLVLRSSIEEDRIERMLEAIKIEKTVDILLDYAKRNILNPDMNLPAILKAFALRVKDLACAEKENDD